MKRTFYLALILGVCLAAGACGKKDTAETPATPAPGAAKATPVDPATAATLSGVVKYQGAAPRGRRISMDNDPACVGLHTSPVRDEEVVVNNGMLANVVVYVKDGLGNRTFDTPGEPIVLDQHGCMYTPRVISVQANQTIEFVNSDPTTHNVHWIPKNNREGNKSQTPGAAPIVERFAREEVAIPVKCNVHPWMKSYIAVLRHPYHAVTRDAGSFTLKNLPPGEYVIAAWHEVLGTSEQKVTLGPSESKTIEFVFQGASGD